MRAGKHAALPTLRHSYPRSVTLSRNIFLSLLAGGTISVALELERDAHLGAIGLDLSLVELHVQFDDFRDPQVSQCLACPFHGGLGRLLPGLGAGSDQRDDFVN